MNKKARDFWIDSARGLVIVLMLIGHSDPPLVVKKMIHGFHIPFFFILSGYLFDYQKWSNLGFKELLKDRVRKYLLPYFVLSSVNLIINLPVEILRSDTSLNQILKTTLNHIFWTFWGYRTAVTSPNCTPLWFLTALFLSTLFLYFLLKISNSRKSFLICVIAVFMCAICTFLNVPTHAIPWHLEVSFVGMSFMLIGYKLRECKAFEKQNISLLIATPLLIIGIYAVYSNSTIIDLNTRHISNVILLFVGAISISYNILILFKYIFPRSNFFTFLGKNTILIMAFNYAINTYAIASIKSIFNNFTLSWWMLSIIDIIVVTLLIFLWSMLKKRYPKIAIF